jgi:hypothetical protein
MVEGKGTGKESTRTIYNLNQIQLQRLTELNVELVTCVTRMLKLIDDYCGKYNISILDDPKVEYLVGQALFLIYEINGEMPHQPRLNTAYDQPKNDQSLILGALQIDGR